MRSYMVKYTENEVNHTQMFASLKDAKEFAEQKKGMIYIADGKHTKSLAGTDIP